MDWHKPLDSGVPNLVHYTEGGPWFPDYRNVDYSKQWFEELKAYEATLPTKRMLCPYELFSTRNSKPLEGYPNSNDKWDWSMDDEWQSSKDKLQPGLAN